MPRSSQTRAVVALIAIAALWGSYPATAKLALRDISPFVLTTVRCTLGSVLLLVLLRRSGVPLGPDLGWRALRSFFILGLTGITMATGFTYVGLTFTTAGNGVILQAASPVMVALGARFYLGERLTRTQAVGAATSVLGVLVVVTKGRLAALAPEELRAGDFIILASLAAWSVYTIYGKRVLAEHSAAVATTAAYVLGTLMLVPIALVTAPLFPTPRLASPVAWAVIVYQATIGALAHVWWYRAVDVVGPSRASVFMNLQPLVGLILAWLLVGEKIGGWQLLGAALVLGGVALTTRDHVPA